MRSKEVLSPTSYLEYQSQWNSFKDKKVLASPREVHSGKPVISKPMVYKSQEAIVTRSNVFQNILRTTDPYDTFKKYGHPIWHLTHYFKVLEQMYHASASAIRNGEDYAVKDTFEGQPEFRAPLFWDESASIELVITTAEKPSKFEFSENVYFIFYKRDRFPSTEIPLRTYGNKRSYLIDLQALENTKCPIERSKICDRLIRKINMQHVRHTQWVRNPRKSLCVSRDCLLQELLNNSCNVSHFNDFFSWWDPSR